MDVSDINDPVILQAFNDAMEDVHTRFLLNLPAEELATADRILFQIEQAWWFYEDWICDQQDANGGCVLPRFKNLRPFAVQMFKYSFLLEEKEFHSMWALFSNYKRKISTYGCILLNEDCSKIILCQDWNSKSWTLPAGKINQNEDGMEAAARETWEETGFDPNAKYGLTAQMASSMSWEKPNDQNYVSYKDEIGKHRNFYICKGVPEDFPFDPVARKEVAAVQWHPLDKIPKKNFAVLPLLPKIRNWIKRNQNRDKSNPKAIQKRNATSRNKRDSANTTPLKSNKTPNRKKKNSSRSRSRGHASVITEDDDPLLESGLGAVGSTNRWSEEDMFQANERLLGRKIEYDGNPHAFCEQGFQSNDPHHFHIVGGKFSSGTDQLAPPPQTNRLQHLFHNQTSNSTGDDNNDDSEFLTPFFSNEGATPWGEVVKEVQGDPICSAEIGSIDPASTSVNKGKPNKFETTNKQPNLVAGDDDDDLVFMTDEQITSRSQKVKLADHPDQKYQQDLLAIQNWVQKLPKAPATNRFGTFQFNTDSLMDALYQCY